jgi:hypothetical protein
MSESAIDSAQNGINGIISSTFLKVSPGSTSSKNNSQVFLTKGQLSQCGRVFGGAAHLSSLSTWPKACCSFSLKVLFQGEGQFSATES